MYITVHKQVHLPVDDSATGWLVDHRDPYSYFMDDIHPEDVELQKQQIAP